jgi:hypothetical protein
MFELGWSNPRGKDSEGVYKNSNRGKGADKNKFAGSMGSEWTSSHKHQPHATSSSSTIFSDVAHKRRIINPCNIMYIQGGVVNHGL